MKCQSVCQPACPSVCLTVSPPVHQSVWLSVRLSVSLSDCQSACPSVCLTVSPSEFKSVCLLVRMSVSPLKTAYGKRDFLSWYSKYSILFEDFLFQYLVCWTISHSIKDILYYCLFNYKKRYCWFSFFLAVQCFDIYFLIDFQQFICPNRPWFD